MKLKSLCIYLLFMCFAVTGFANINIKGTVNENEKSVEHSDMLNPSCIKGKITDSKTGKVMPYATVYLLSQRRGTLTDDREILKLIKCQKAK